MLHTRTVSFARHDSGRQLCDSGDYYGRHYDSPPPPADAPLVYADTRYPDHGAAISTVAWFDTFITEHATLTAAWQTSPEHADVDTSWWDALETFMEREGYRQVVYNNTYNSDNDFDQQFVYQVWVPDGTVVYDWMYADDAVAVFFIHTGCDVRSGYAPPIIAQSCRETGGDYVFPLDWSVRYHLADWRSPARDDYYDATFYDVCDRHGDAVTSVLRDRQWYTTFADGTECVLELNEEY